MIACAPLNLSECATVESAPYSEHSPLIPHTSYLISQRSVTIQTLILTRHGETTYSSRALADSDPSRQIPLTAKGRAQAQALGRELIAVPIDLCITSEFPRTIQTADLALSGRAIPRVIDACFDDISYGSFEGKPLSQYEEWQQTHPMDMAPPRSDESRVGAVRHYRQGLRRVLARKEHTILLVIHDFPLGVILRAAHGEDPTDHTIHIPYATPTRLSETDVRHASSHLEKWLQGWKPRS